MQPFRRKASIRFAPETVALESETIEFLLDAAPVTCRKPFGLNAVAPTYSDAEKMRKMELGLPIGYGDRSFSIVSRREEKPEGLSELAYSQ